MQETYHFPPNQQQLTANQQPFKQNQQQFLPNQQQFPVQQQPVQHVIVLQIPNLNNLTVEDHPVHTCCPSCHANISTNVTKEMNANTHILALILCFMCCIPCALIPYFCDTTKSSVHTCPQCNAYIGTYNPNRRSYNRRW